MDRLGKLHIWEVTTWENTIGMLPLGENAFGKLPNIFIKDSRLVRSDLMNRKMS